MGWPHAYCWLLAGVMGMVASVFPIIQQVGPIGQCQSGRITAGLVGRRVVGSLTLCPSFCLQTVCDHGYQICAPGSSFPPHKLSDYSQLWLMLFKACDIQGTLICRKLLLGYKTFLSWTFLH